MTLLSGNRPPGARSVRVRRLALTDFRSYPKLDLEIATSRIALTGENGVGKTNVLEALSLFAPGRGLRGADFADCARDDGPGGWAASIELETAGGVTQLGTGLAAPSGGQSSPRLNRIDRAPVASSGAFAEWIRPVWLSPEMDLLFVGPPADRRRFLDRLALALDANHASRVASLERASRSRNRLLEEFSPNGAWLDAIEQQIAELSVAVAAARVETISRLTAAIAARRSDAGPFPWPDLELGGEIEELSRDRPALEIEERQRRFLRDNRSRDAAAKRTAAGLRSADLLVRHGPKQMPANRCSTGEQKALLVAIMLAHASVVADATGLAPIVLLDEVSAHLDPLRRAALYADLGALGCQVWITGADPAAFAELGENAEVFLISPGRASPLAKP